MREVLFGFVRLGEQVVDVATERFIGAPAEQPLLLYALRKVSLPSRVQRTMALFTYSTSSR